MVIQKTGNRTLYCRTTSEKRKELQNELLKLYKLNEKENSAFVFPSGMSATNAIFNTHSTGGEKVFLLGDEMYSDTFRIVEYQKRYNHQIDVLLVDIRKTDQIFQIFRENKTI